MKADEENLERIAKEISVSLNPKELRRMSLLFKEMEKWFEKLNEVDTTDIEPTENSPQASEGSDA